MKKIIIIITAIIIVLAGWILLFQLNLSYSLLFKEDPTQKTSLAADKIDIAYLEKIENFEAKEYSQGKRLIHTLNAKTYYSYISSPIQLEEVELKTYDSNEQEGFLLNSNHAKILESGEIIFDGQVFIRTKNNAFHELKTESLTYYPDKGIIETFSDILYVGENAKIYSQGMTMQIDLDNLSLNGVVKIIHDSDSRIDSSNLNVSYSNGKKIYQSNEETVYHSNNNRISADSGLNIDMNENLTKLYGNVVMQQDSGAQILTSNLIINQSNGVEIYKTYEPTQYISVQSNIESNQMTYNAIEKKIDLSGDVIAVYE